MTEPAGPQPVVSHEAWESRTRREPIEGDGNDHEPFGEERVDCEHCWHACACVADEPDPWDWHDEKHRLCEFCHYST